MIPRFEHETFPIDSPDAAAKLRRFWKKADVRGNDECWPWIGATKGKGYGSFWDEGRPVRAHRAAWLFSGKSIPHGMHVLHRCDNRLCVNPAHLFLGTTEINNNDMASKLRHGSRKLSPEQVLEIRQSKELTGTLAKKFGVQWNVIDKARRGLTWQHVSGPTLEPEPTVTDIPRSRRGKYILPLPRDER